MSKNKRYQKIKRCFASILVILFFLLSFAPYPVSGTNRITNTVNKTKEEPEPVPYQMEEKNNESSRSEAGADESKNKETTEEQRNTDNEKQSISEKNIKGTQEEAPEKVLTEEEKTAAERKTAEDRISYGSDSADESAGTDNIQIKSESVQTDLPSGRKDEENISGNIHIIMSHGGTLTFSDENGGNTSVYNVDESGKVYINGTSAERAEEPDTQETGRTDQKGTEESTSEAAIVVSETEPDKVVSDNPLSENDEAHSNRTRPYIFEDTKDNKPVIMLDKPSAYSAKLVFNADDGFVISEFAHSENGKPVNDGPIRSDLSKTVTMMLPASDTVSDIKVTFEESGELSEHTEKMIEEEENKLASGERVLAALIDTDSEMIPDDQKEMMQNIDPGETKLSSAPAAKTGASQSGGDTILVGDSSLPTSVTIYNTGHVINYSHYGGSRSDTDLHHLYSTSEDSTRRTAYCIDPGKTSPVNGAASASLAVSAVDNANLYKVLFYGYGGPGDITGSIEGWSADDILIFTRLCAVYAFSGQDSSYTFRGCSQYMIDRTMDLWNLIMRQADPLVSMRFTPSEQTVGPDQDRSADITFVSQGGNSVNVTVPEGVALYNKTRPELNWENGTTKVYAGDVFYMVTGKKDYTYDSGPVTGNVSAMLMFVTESLNNTRQRLVGWVPENLRSSFKIHWSDVPEIKKTVNRESNNIGEIQTWKIEAEIPNEEISSFKITDTLDPRLDYAGNLKLTTETDSGNMKAAYTGNTCIYNETDWGAVFDPDWYAARYPDIREAFGEDREKMLKHFISTGIYDVHTMGRGGFDVNVYMNDPSNSGLKDAYGNDKLSYYRHFCLWGINEGRVCADLTDKGDDPDYTVNYDEKSRTLTVSFRSGDSAALNSHVDKLTLMQNRKIVITFDTKINSTAKAGEEIENKSILNCNNSTSESKPAKVYTGEAAVRKADDAHNPVAGAVFGIWTVDGEEKKPVVLDGKRKPVCFGDENYDKSAKQMTAVSGKDGLAIFHGLKDGTYIFREIEAPKGYTLNSVYSNKVTIVKGKMSPEENVPEIIDHKPMQLRAGGPGNTALYLPALTVMSVTICLIRQMLNKMLNKKTVS